MRAALAAGLLAVAVGACGSDEDASGLPACAADLPVPAGVEVVEVTAAPTEANPTCAVTLASDEAVDDVVAAWEAALERANVEVAVQHVPGARGVLRLEGPTCGSVLVFAAGTERVTDAVAGDRTPVLASVLPC